MPQRMSVPPAWVMGLPNALRHAASRLSRWFQPSGLAIYDLVLETYAGIAMGVAAQMDLAGLLADGPLGVGELADRTGADPASLYRLLRALASRGIFREDKAGRFRNTGLSRALIDGPGSMRHLAISHLDGGVLELFGDLRRSVETGESAARRRYGTGLFDYLDTRPELARHFDQAMADTSRLSADIILASYPFGRHRQVVDVGGGSGTMLRAILEDHPGLRGVLFDRQSVVAASGAVAREPAVEARLTAIGGDFFRDMPAGADLYFLKNIIHDWDDAAAGRILAAIRRVMAADGRLVLVDFVIEAGNGQSIGKLSDLLMLVGLDGARERSRQDFGRLLAGSGFDLERIAATVGPFSLIVGKPR